MTVVIKVDAGGFDKETLATALKSLSRRDFVDNDGETLTFTSGKYAITMTGHIAAAAGQEPIDWDLNNSQINTLSFTHNGQTIAISGLAMNLREIYQSRVIDDLRDWNDFTKRQDYNLIGSNRDDVIKAAPHGRSIIEGRGGDDRLVALGTNDKLIGGAGNDTLVVRGEGTWLRGGAGNDTFVLRHADAGVRILDFEAGRDRLDFGTIADKLARNGDLLRGGVRFIGDDDFNHGRNEIRTDIRHSSGSTYTAVELSLNGHHYTLAELKGVHHLDWNDFLF